MKNLVICLILFLIFNVVSKENETESSDGWSEVGRLQRYRIDDNTKDRFFVFKKSDEDDFEILSLYLTINKYNKVILKTELDFKASNFPTFILSPTYLRDAKISLTYKDMVMNSKIITIEKNGLELLAPDEYIVFERYR